MSFNGNKYIRILAPVLMAYAALASSAEPSWMTSMISECDSGVTQECLNLGVAYTNGQYKGKKIGKDKGKAKQYISKAIKKGQQNCRQGDNVDCYTLGLLFFQGGGIVPADIPRGLEFLQRSCRGGYKEACDWLDNSGLGRGG